MSFNQLIAHALTHLSPTWRMGGTGGGSVGGRSLGSWAHGGREGNLGASYGSITFAQNGQNHDLTLASISGSAAIGGSRLVPDLPRSFSLSPSVMPTFYASRIGRGPLVQNDLTLGDMSGAAFGISLGASFCLGTDVTLWAFGANEAAFMAAMALTTAPSLIFGAGGFMAGMANSPAWLLMKGVGFVVGSSFGLQGGIGASIIRGHIFQ